MSFVYMIVIDIHPLKDFMTELALVLLPSSVFALDMFIDVGTFVTFVIADHTTPELPSEVFHPTPGLVIRIDKFVAPSLFLYGVWPVNLPVMIDQTPHEGEVLVAQFTPVHLPVVLLMIAEAPPCLEDLVAQVTREGHVQVNLLPVVVQAGMVTELSAAHLTCERGSMWSTGVLVHTPDVFVQVLLPLGLVVALLAGVLPDGVTGEVCL